MLEVSPAFRAHDLQALSSDARGHHVAVRTAMASQARHDQPQHVEHLAHRSHGAAGTRNRRALTQCQRGRQVLNAVDVRPLGLGQPPPAVRAQPFEEAVHPLRVQRAERKRRLARSRHPDHGHHPPQRHVNIEIAQRVVTQPPDLDHLRQTGDHGRTWTAPKITHDPISSECALKSTYRHLKDLRRRRPPATTARLRARRPERPYARAAR